MTLLENGEVNLDELQSLMREVAAGISDAIVEVGRTARPRHDDVFIKLTSRTESHMFAIISTQGSGTFELRVNGGFYTGIADDLADVEDVRGYLESYIRAARAYLDGHWSIRKSRVLRVPILTIQRGASRLNLASPRHWSSNDSRLAF
jgi:hypothetical protein